MAVDPEVALEVGSEVGTEVDTQQVGVFSLPSVGMAAAVPP
jgi:hypothetical protein